MAPMIYTIPTVLMRGGSSKGLYFLASDLPWHSAERDRILLAAMGSPDVRQIDGMGGGDDQTSKVMIVGPSKRPGIDVEYLFAQVSVMRNLVEMAGREVVLLDGVKVLHEEGWVLALPDLEEPLTHIWAEGANDVDAWRLAQEYSRRIRQLLR